MVDCLQTNWDTNSTETIDITWVERYCYSRRRRQSPTILYEFFRVLTWAKRSSGSWTKTAVTSNSGFNWVAPRGVVRDAGGNIYFIATKDYDDGESLYI